MILKTIEVRLEIIGEATRRARLTFIIVIIASSAMLITLWNTYYSYTAKVALDDSIEFKASKFDTSKFIENLNKKNPLSEYLYNKFDLETQKSLDQFRWLNGNKSDENIKQQSLINEKLQKIIIDKINYELLTNSMLYTSQELKNK